MGHVVRNTDWCCIDVNTTTGQIFMQERWKYNWIVAPGVAAWTREERRTFHNTADRAIWATWSNRCKMGARGGSSFARRFSGRPLPINLDIRWVLTDHHWYVTVKKIPPGAFETSSVQWAARTITLDSNDIRERQFDNGAGQPRTTQIPVAHEFGHAAGNTATLNRGDEYRNGHTHEDDLRSVMNVGHGLRRRHFDTIIEELNQMIPDTTFFVQTL